MELNHNYVIFNWSDYRNGAGFGDGYYSICLEDLKNEPQIYINNAPFQHFPNYLHLQLLYRALCRIKMPFTKYFYHIACKIKTDKPLCFIFIRYPEVNYVKWLRAKYPNAIFVKFIRDLISTQQKIYDTFNKANVIDYWITYDKNESDKYGLYYYPEIGSKIELPETKIEQDVFFAGRAKNRLPKLIEVYDYLTKAGLKCKFYIVGVKSEEQIQRDGITYSMSQMTYKDMLISNLKSKCILEINQIGAIGLTSRYLEAVMYNKLLITDNQEVKMQPLYNRKYIKCFEDISTVDFNFINEYDMVDYKYNGEFSPCGLIKFIDGLIIK